MEKLKSMSVNRIAFIGNYLPRQCGIATFTTDLCEAVASRFGEKTCIAVPITDKKNVYDYPPRVRFEIIEEDLTSYQKAAEFLNHGHVDVVCLQHEYGIFGGSSGRYVLSLLHDLEPPFVTTLHTVLRQPNDEQKAVLQEIASLSSRLIVMNKTSMIDLQHIYGVPSEKIQFIPHGIPDVPFVDSNYYKDRFGVEGKTVLSTFGLLSSGKGIENVILALPKILERFPNIVYLVLGTTHPNVKLHEGEKYRDGLFALAKKLGVQDHVKFLNRFSELEELTAFMGATDIYVTPYLNPEQAVSGTLAYMVGAGKAVISTSYYYAQELLSEGRGVLVPFGDPEAIVKETLHLLSDEVYRLSVRKKAYQFGRQMIWPRVAEEYMKVFQQAREERLRTPRMLALPSGMESGGKLPYVRLDHVERMTDDTGILQHAICSAPNYAEGYCTDDNARALIVAVLLESQGEGGDRVHELARRYLAFLSFAFNPNKKAFRNFLSYDRRWLEEIGSEDSFGRAIWGLGTALGYSTLIDLRKIALKLFSDALPSTLQLQNRRSWAFTILGIEAYLRRYPEDRNAKKIKEQLGERLLQMLEIDRAPDWPWFQDRLTYCNAVLPHALLLYGKSNPKVRTEALNSLKWLMTIQEDNGHFVPIGNQGFFVKGKERARFDQQPVEAQCTVSACLEAYRITGDEAWHKKAEMAFEWFLGRNDLGLPLYDWNTNGCQDGLQPDRTNQNQGAESTLAFLHSLIEMRSLEGMINPVEKLRNLVGVLDDYFRKTR